MANYTTDDILNEFTTAMHIDDGTNWQKYYSIWDGPIEDVQNKLTMIDQSNDLDNCSGQMLDDVARNYDIQRDGDDDDFLRFRIKSHILVRLCDGSMPKLYDLVSSALGCKPTDFKIQTMWDVDGSPNTIAVKDIPADYAEDARKTALLLDTIQDAVAYGIRVDSVSFQTYLSQQAYTAVVVQHQHVNYVTTPQAITRDHVQAYTGIGVQHQHVNYVQTNKKE